MNTFKTINSIVLGKLLKQYKLNKNNKTFYDESLNEFLNLISFIEL